jgi:hypothetical protein
VALAAGPDSTTWQRVTVCGCQACGSSNSA